MKSDIQIQQDVIDQLKWEPVLHAAEIGVAVKNGIVTLSGIVDTYSEKIAAENAAKKVAGVRAVAEDIQVGVSPDFRKTDTEIAEAVLNMLKWNTKVPHEKITIKVDDGVVSMEGEVEREYQRDTAAEAVEHLAGVRRINNYITIKPLLLSGEIQQKIAAAFQRSDTIDAGKIKVELDGSKIILSGKVRSFAERKDAGAAAWAAPGVSHVENNLVLDEEGEFAF